VLVRSDGLCDGGCGHDQAEVKPQPNSANHVVVTVDASFLTTVTTRKPLNLMLSISAKVSFALLLDVLTHNSTVYVRARNH
jgi:hypothetical protein